MKTEFAEALISENRNVNMPEEMDWFGALIGDWDMIWRQDIGTEKEFVCKGEWIFSRVLNGFGIQDLFIVPSREERIRLNMPNAEYGTTIRMYCPSQKNWQVYYTCVGEYTRLTAEKEGEQIVITEQSAKRMKWVFSDITDKSFHWQNFVLDKDDKWTVMCDCTATRKQR